MEELKPCPFCGGKAIKGSTYFMCLNNDCDGMALDWNTRPIEDRLRRERDELKALLDEAAYAANWVLDVARGIGKSGERPTHQEYTDSMNNLQVYHGRILAKRKEK